ncbi:MAG: phytoene desaturase family protein [Gemmataceae bacterium]
MNERRTGKIGVIGSGLGGLAATVTLAARGYEVVLFEKSSWLGGKAAAHQEHGYRFDMGPTILTLPSVLRKIAEEAGKDLDQELDLIPLDPQWRCFYSDQTVLDLVSNVDDMVGKIGEYAKDGKSAEGYRDFIKFSHRLHNISDKFFFWRSLGSIWDMFDFKSMFKPSMLADVLSMRMGKTVAEAIRSHVPDERVAQMLDHFTQYVGSAPDQSPAVLCSIAHMQTEEGIWYPKGGTRAVPVFLEKLCQELGVEVRTETGIRRILVSDSGEVEGIETDSGEQVSLAAVVCNADTHRTHHELINGKARQRFEKRNHEPACSGVVIYLGLDRRYDQLLHHNFVFSRDHQEEFDAIYRKGEPAPDPTAYLCAPAISEPEVAPEGGEALYILVHTPYLRPHHDWKKLYPEYRQVIFDKLANTAGMTDLESRIRYESYLTPQDIHDRYHVYNGAIYGLASHGRYMGAFKPANRSPDVNGLYFAGGSAHPGPGMPMVLMSGWIAANTLDQDQVVEKTQEMIGASS